VLIAGGGVAALEAALALRALAGDLVSTTLLAPSPEFVYRPMRVREPFGYSPAQRYPLDAIARDVGADLVADAFKWLDGPARVVHTAGGQALEYDVLLLALGARARPRFRHALTIDDGRLDEQMQGVLTDVGAGRVHKLAFVVPSTMAWPLPIYELALLTARRADEMNVEPSITILTPEDAPLAVFGSKVSAKVEEVLEENGILVVPGAYCEVPEPGQVAIHPGLRRIYADRVVALPQLFGPPTPGVPKHAQDGFISVDPHGRVTGLENVYAAGDATSFRVKFGGIAAQQADSAAESIAALAGAKVKPKPFEPVVHAVLLGARKPLYLSAHLAGSHGSSSEISESPSWSPPSKIAARYLGPYLDGRDRLGAVLV
jgi:sulfide:quinone oxidoreductase